MDLTTLGIKDKRLSTGQVMSIKQPEPRDIDALLEYLQTSGAQSDNMTFCSEEFAAGAEHGRTYIENAIRDDRSLMLIGIVEEKIIAFAYIRALKNDHTAHNSTLSMSVSKPFWHRGIGGTMMRAMIMFARTHSNVKTIHIGVRSDNTGLITLYQIYGFTQTGTHKNYYQEDGIFYDQSLMDLIIR